MEIARFEFAEDAAGMFGWSQGQYVVEMAFPCIIELVEYMKEIEDVIENVSVLTEGKVINIKEFTG